MISTHFLQTADGTFYSKLTFLLVQARVEEAIKLIVAATTRALGDDPERLAIDQTQLPASKAVAKLVTPVA